MKKLGKLTTLMLAFTFAVVALTACSGKAKIMALNMAHVDVYTYSDNVLSTKLTGTAVNGNKVSMMNGRLTVDVAANVDEVEFDLSPFFANTDLAAYKGANFYFTRSDVTKTDSTELVKGYAWVQVDGTASNRLYKQLGYENDATKTPMNKGEIAALENQGGAARMYIITEGTQNGKHVLYIDSSTNSEIAEGKTDVTFKFYGHNSKKSELKVTVNKATA